MIEINGIYKLKHIKNLGKNDEADYKVLAMDGEYIICEKLNGEDAGTKYFFMKEFLIDPEKLDDIYYNLIKKI